MKKFKIIGDSTNLAGFSTHTIVSSINNAAKNIGAYDKDGIKVKYDSLCQTHGDEVDCYISTYEISFPDIILNNASNKPIIGVSKDNESFIINGGYNKELVGSLNLGVDSCKWSKIEKTKDLDKFCVGVYTESLIRGGIELVVEGFSKAFSGQKDIVLKIKDRNATDTFKNWIKKSANYFNITIEYINDNWDIYQVKEWLSGVDCQIYTNRSSTFALPPLELMSCGIPTVIIPYSGPKDYCNNDNSLLIDYNITSVSSEINSLISIGCRNFFFLNGYKNEPVWATCKIDSISDKLKELRNNIKLKESLSINGINTAKSMTWEKSAENLSELLDRWF